MKSGLFSNLHNTSEIKLQTSNRWPLGNYFVYLYRHPFLYIAALVCTSTQIWGYVLVWIQSGFESRGARKIVKKEVYAHKNIIFPLPWIYCKMWYKRTFKKIHKIWKRQRRSTEFIGCCGDWFYDKVLPWCMLFGFLRALLIAMYHSIVKQSGVKTPPPCPSTSDSMD